MADNLLGLLQFKLTKVYSVFADGVDFSYGAWTIMATPPQLNLPMYMTAVGFWLYHSWGSLLGCFWLCLMHSHPPACETDFILLLAVSQWGCML